MDKSAPNLREVDCCATCEFGIKWHFKTRIVCIEGDSFVKPYNICDDFKREE